MFSKGKPKTVKEPAILKEMKQNSDGNLVAVLSGAEHEAEMSEFLRVLQAEFRLDDHKRKEFTYSYDSKTLSFIIVLNDIRKEEILADFAVNNLLAPRGQKSGQSPRR